MSVNRPRPAMPWSLRRIPTMPSCCLEGIGMGCHARHRVDLLRGNSFGGRSNGVYPANVRASSCGSHCARQVSNGLVAGQSKDAAKAQKWRIREHAKSDTASPLTDFRWPRPQAMLRWWIAARATGDLLARHAVENARDPGDGICVSSIRDFDPGETGSSPGADRCSTRDRRH